KQGIADGFLAPYKVLKVGINVDLEGWRPEEGKTDKSGNIVADRIYNRRDYDRNLVIDERTLQVAHRVTEFLSKTNKYDKTIIFCVDIDHAERMRQAITNFNSGLVQANHKYVMRITGDDDEGKRELDNFINPEETYPVIATTSKLMTTGIDAQTCKLIVLDSNIQSMTEFKQIIGRGSRINEEYDKSFFTIMDFRNVTDMFADPAFDGDPVMIKEVAGDEPLSEEDIHPEEQEEIIDEGSGEPIDFGDEIIVDHEEPHIIDGGEIESQPVRKIYVAGVDVSILNERVQFLDSDGALITESLKEYTKRNILKTYRNLNHFLSRWNSADKKKVLIDELEAEGIILDNLKEEVKKDLDLFDLICHVAWDMPALTRRERADNVKKRNYFTKYGEQARNVIEALLDKYASEGIENIEDLAVLRIAPFKHMGTPAEIVKLFGGKNGYLKMIKELETHIYRKAA
ncbi:MAG: EcoAI/FtnUII family type I restriction enzme subunit R, partial [bacterium]